MISLRFYPDIIRINPRFEPISDHLRKILTEIKANEPLPQEIINDLTLPQITGILFSEYSFFRSNMSRYVSLCNFMSAVSFYYPQELDPSWAELKVSELNIEFQGNLKYKINGIGKTIVLDQFFLHLK